MTATTVKRPPAVRRAIYQEDRETLSFLGKKGAQKSAQVRRQNSILKEYFRKMLLDDAARHEQELYNGVPESDR